jgi:flavorubredoxin
VRAGLEQAGLEVTERAVVELEPAALRDELELADLLLIGTPTINRDAPTPVWGALALLSTIHPKAKLAAVFGSYGWSGEAVKLVEARLTGLKYNLAAPGLCFRFKPTATDIDACRQFGQTVAASLTGSKD